MSEDTEYVEVHDKSEDNAILLLAAAEELKLDPGVVRTTSDSFIAPREVTDVAFGKGKNEASKSKRDSAEKKAEELADEQESEQPKARDLSSATPAEAPAAEKPAANEKAAKANKGSD